MKKLYISQIYESEIEVLKSKFISMLVPLNSTNEVEEFLKKAKSDYPKARHYVYAYIFDDKLKSNDDGEPSGTAGRPLLDLLMKSNLNRCLVIVVRYFGGSLLGASRLLRTYVESAKKSIEKAKIFKKCSVFEYKIEIDMSKRNIFEEFCKVNSLKIEKLIYNINCINYDISSNEEIDELINSNNFIKLLEKNTKIRLMEE